MVEAHTTIFTREWWITVFLVGLGIHLLASYLKPRLDQIGGWFSKSWANRNEKRARARQERIDALKRSRRAKANTTTEEFRARLMGLQWLVVSCSALLLTNLVASVSQKPKWDAVFLLFAALLTSFLGLNEFRNASSMHIEMLEAEKQQCEAQQEQLKKAWEGTLKKLLNVHDTDSKD